MKLLMDIAGNGARKEIGISDGYDMASELCREEYRTNGADGSKSRCFYTNGLALIDVQAVFPQRSKVGLCFDRHVAAMVFCAEGGCGLLRVGGKGGKRESG